MTNGVSTNCQLLCTKCSIANGECIAFGIVFTSIALQHRGAGGVHCLVVELDDLRREPSVALRNRIEFSLFNRGSGEPNKDHVIALSVATHWRDVCRRPTDNGGDCFVYPVTCFERARIRISDTEWQSRSDLIDIQTRGTEEVDRSDASRFVLRKGRDGKNDYERKFGASDSCRC